LTLKKFIVLLSAMFAFAVATAAQVSVTPVIVEGKGRPRAHGEFTVTNVGLAPVLVQIEPMSFTPQANGDAAYRALDPGTHVTLTQSSAKIGAKQSHTFAYQVQCDKLPCFFTLYAASITGHTAQGVAVKMLIPSTVYLCEKQKDCRYNILKSFNYPVKK
jgi:hypothetical protein